jgi:hypothetical protein
VGGCENCGVEKPLLGVEMPLRNVRSGELGILAMSALVLEKAVQGCLSSRTDCSGKLPLPHGDFKNDDMDATESDTLPISLSVSSKVVDLLDLAESDNEDLLTLMLSSFFAGTTSIAADVP